jgi:hypothetical protein
MPYPQLRYHTCSATLQLSQLSRNLPCSMLPCHATCLTTMLCLFPNASAPAMLPISFLRDHGISMLYALALIPYSQLCTMSFAHATALLSILLLSDHIHLLFSIFTCLATLFTAFLSCPLSKHLFGYLLSCSAIMAFCSVLCSAAYYLIHIFAPVSILHASALLQSTCAHAICFALLTSIHFLSNYGFNCSALCPFICNKVFNCSFYTLQRKSHLCIPRKGIARPQSKYPHSCVCERFIYSQGRSTYFPAAEQADHSCEYIIHSQTHDCGNWD